MQQNVTPWLNDTCNQLADTSAFLFSDEGTKCWSTCIIDEYGTFNFGGIENFANQVKLAKYDISYAVVSIIGPQNSGIVTLICVFLGGILLSPHFYIAWYGACPTCVWCTTCDAKMV